MSPLEPETSFESTFSSFSWWAVTERSQAEDGEAEGEERRGETGETGTDRYSKRDEREREREREKRERTKTLFVQCQSVPCYIWLMTSGGRRLTTSRSFRILYLFLPNLLFL